jgi:Fur family ferric uptake transcriptional regulator
VVQLPSVEVSQSPEAKFREYLASRSKPQRCTKQQERMVRFIFSQHNHFDAEKLIDDMKQAGLPVSRATVYRTLTKLVDAGLLRRLELGPSMYYEHDYGYPQHEHLYCQQCGAVIEFQHPELDAIIREVGREHGFHASSHTFIVRGTCSDCNRARVTKRRLDLV